MYRKREKSRANIEDREREKERNVYTVCGGGMKEKK